MNSRIPLTEPASNRNHATCERLSTARRFWLSAWGCVAMSVVLLSGCDGSEFDLSELMTDGEKVIAPAFETPVDTDLVDSLEVELSCDTEGATIYYTTDGSEPDEFSNVYSGSIHIEETTTIRARAYLEDLPASEVVEATYSISGFPLGLLELDPTQYNSIPLAIVPAMGELPPLVDMRPYMPPAGDQGQQGSCVGWAVGYALKTYQENVEHGWGADSPDHQFSPSYIYNQIKVGSCMSGSYISSAFNLLSDQGCSTWASMPYNQATCSAYPSPEAQEEAQRYRISSWRRVNAQDTTEVRAQLAGGFPIVIGMRVYTNFFYVRGDEIYDRIQGSWQGNHAICVVGYDDDTSTFRIINSWGTGWGDQGYCRIGYDVFRQITFEAYAAQDIVEQTYDLTVSTSGEGSVTLDPPGGTYYMNQAVQLTASAAEGWRFARWEGDLTGWSNPASVTMDSSKFITAVFEREMYTLTISVVGGGTTDPAVGSHLYLPDEAVQITTTPAQGCERWAFSKWLGDASGADSPITVTMDGNKSITAEFRATNQPPQAYNQKLSSSGSSPVDITLSGSDPDLDALTYEITSQPTNGHLQISDLPLLSYVPNEGFVGKDSFNFRVSDGCSQSSDGTIEVFLDAPIQYTVTVEQEGEGSIVPFDGQKDYDAGTEVTLTALPAEGWRFDRWEGDATDTSTSITFTVESDMDLKAVFEIPVDVTVSTEGWGTVTLDPPGGSYAKGTWVTLTAQATAGYRFVNWQGNLSGTNLITTVIVESAMSIEAVFVQSPPSISLLASRTRIPWVVQFDMRLKDSSGHAIGEGVTRDNFLIYEGGDLLDYTETNQFVTNGPALPMKVMLVLDYTNSMKTALAIDDMIAAAQQFVQATTDAGEPVFTGTHSIGIVEFHDRTSQGAGYDEVVPLTRADSEGKAQIISGIPCEDCREHGLSRVWDAVKLAMTKITQADFQQGEARAVVFLTDGRDTTSTETSTTLSTFALANNIMLYPIGFGDVEDNEAMLQSLAQQTGGTYHPAEGAASLQVIFAQIAKDLNGQWNLTYITQRNSGSVNVLVEFDWQSGAEFTYTFNAGTIAGDIHTGYIKVLERSYDSDADTTSFLLKAEYVPRNITYFNFIFGHSGATLELQDNGGLTSGWTLTPLADADYELQGAELQYGAFGNIGIVTVPGSVAKLKIRHNDDNDVYFQLYQQYGVTKKIEFEGTLWESF